MIRSVNPQERLDSIAKKAAWSLVHERDDRLARTLTAILAEALGSVEIFEKVRSDIIGELRVK